MRIDLVACDCFALVHSGYLFFVSRQAAGKVVSGWATLSRSKAHRQIQVSKFSP